MRRASSVAGVKGLSDDEDVAERASHEPVADAVAELMAMTAHGHEPCVELLGEREDLPERIARHADGVHLHSLSGEQSGGLGEEPPLLLSLRFAYCHEPRADGLRRPLHCAD